MDATASRLLCIDLQVDPAAGLEPDPHAIFGARQLIAMGRRLGWTIVHARRQANAGDARIPGIRPLKSERVFFRPGRSIAEAPGLCTLLEGWQGETVYVASFDHVALTSCLLLAYEHGPHFVLVEDALAAGKALAGRPQREAFRTVQAHLARGATSIRRILAEGPRRVA